MVTLAGLRRRRAHSRGSTLFVVVLAMTMLTGVGLYTVHSSALLARAAGNERQAQQATYVAQLGTLLALGKIGTSPGAIIGHALEGGDQCLMTQGLNLTASASPSCYEVVMSDLVLAPTATIFAADSFSAGSDHPITGEFESELTDVSRGPLLPGEQEGGFHSYYGKVTTMAVLKPVSATTACVENVMQVAGQHVTRAHVILGPKK